MIVLGLNESLQRTPNKCDVPVCIVEMTTTPLEPLDPLDLFSSDSVASLSDGFLNIFQPELLRVQDSLRELT